MKTNFIINNNKIVLCGIRTAIGIRKKFSLKGIDYDGKEERNTGGYQNAEYRERSYVLHREKSPQ
jgi:hypothetical protein